MHIPDIIIAIDGYSSTGKSSFARLIANELSFLYLDSGALYRAVTLHAIENGFIFPSGEIDKEKLLRAADFYVNHIRHVFTVSTLRYLIKGGRLSKWKGTAGELLDMKPVLIVDKDGSLQVLKTIRGRKKSLKALIEYAQENIADPSRQIMGICHGEDPDSLQYTKDLLLQAVSPKELVESTIGCALGAHTGRGIIGIVFFDAMNDEFDV